MCQVLDAKNVFTILSTLHTYPGLLKFYQDYYMAKGGILLCRHLIDHEDLVNGKAMEYAVSSSAKRAQEQKKWSEKSYFLRNPTIFEVDHVFSVPMSTQADHSRNCRIDHYSFRRLCTSMDFEVAGTALNNCLINWKPENNPVTVVCRQNRILAAIEVEDNRVIQALGENNQGIDPHDPLYTAIEKWCKRFQISLGVNNE